MTHKDTATGTTHFDDIAHTIRTMRELLSAAENSVSMAYFERRLIAEAKRIARRKEDVEGTEESV